MSEEETKVFDAQEIIESVWLGSIRAAKSHDELLKRNIKYCLTVAADMVEFQEENGKNQFVSPFLRHSVLDVYDTEDDMILYNLPEIFEYIDECLQENKGAILIHCAAGISRSATVLVAYIMWKHQKPLKETLEYVQSKREQVKPNDGFTLQLEELDKAMGDIHQAITLYKKACEE